MCVWVGFLLLWFFKVFLEELKGEKVQSPRYCCRSSLSEYVCGYIYNV